MSSRGVRAICDASERTPATPSMPKGFERDQLVSPHTSSALLAELFEPAGDDADLRNPRRSSRLDDSGRVLDQARRVAGVARTEKHRTCPKWSTSRSCYGEGRPRNPGLVTRPRFPSPVSPDLGSREAPLGGDRPSREGPGTSSDGHAQSRPGRLPLGFH